MATCNPSPFVPSSLPPFFSSPFLPPLFFPLSRVAHTFAVVDWTWSLMTRFTRRKPVLVQHHFIIPHINGSIPTRAILSLMSRDRLSHLIKCQEIWFWPPIQPRVLVKCDVLLHQSYYGIAATQSRFYARGWLGRIVSCQNDAMAVWQIIGSRDHSL